MLISIPFTTSVAQNKVFSFRDLKKLVNERKNERLKKEGGGSASSSSPLSPTKSGGSTPVNYADAMAEMMNRIKLGNVALKSPKRRMSEAPASGSSSPPPRDEEDSTAPDETRQNDKDIFDTCV